MSFSRNIIDISPLISSSIAVFPGDTTFQRKNLLDMRKGDNLTLSSIHTTVHLGAHVDAPSHYSATGESIEMRNLNIYMGETQVIEIDPTRFVANEQAQAAVNKNMDLQDLSYLRIRVADIAHIPLKAGRILFKTKSFPNPDVWTSKFLGLSAELIHYLAQKKVFLVGIDTPSVDPAEDKDLESHHAIYENDMAVLEGIVLTHVEPGIYDLVALPLKIAGADASPVRAVLIQ